MTHVEDVNSLVKKLADLEQRERATTHMVEVLNKGKAVKFDLYVKYLHYQQKFYEETRKDETLTKMVFCHLRTRTIIQFFQKKMSGFRLKTHLCLFVYFFVYH